MAAWRRPTSRGNDDGAVENGGVAEEIARRARGVRRRATGLGAGEGRVYGGIREGRWSRLASFDLDLMNE